MASKYLCWQPVEGVGSGVGREGPSHHTRRARHGTCNIGRTRSHWYPAETTHIHGVHDTATGPASGTHAPHAGSAEWAQARPGRTRPTRRPPTQGQAGRRERGNTHALALSMEDFRSAHSATARLSTTRCTLGRLARWENASSSSTPTEMDRTPSNALLITFCIMTSAGAGEGGGGGWRA